MVQKLIKTGNYLLVVDDSEIKIDDWFYLDDAVVIARYSETIPVSSAKKIIAHLPFSGSPILEGVPLLPPYSRHQEDGIEVICKQEAEKLHDKNRHEDWGIYNELVSDDTALIKIGYNKAREKYKYTEEDMRKAITMARDLEDWQDLVWEYEYDDIIQSLHQYPTEFECEMEWVRDKPYDEVYKVAKTITTAQGVQWVGKYK